jgi:hypothetical protein
MAMKAQRLESPEHEGIFVSLMWFDVISHSGGGELLASQAHDAQRMFPKLCLGSPAPSQVVVEVGVVQARHGSFVTNISVRRH